jgi:hypothetical protein
VFVLAYGAGVVGWLALAVAMNDSGLAVISCVQLLALGLVSIARRPVQHEKPVRPTFWRRALAAWVDFVLLVGCYLLLGEVAERLFLESAYPRPEPMQLYTRRDFEVFQFFAAATCVLTILYLALCYGIFGVTAGQRLAGLRLVCPDGKRPGPARVALRIFTVLVRLFLIFVPGPIVAGLFLLFGSLLLNPALSVALLVGVICFFIWLAARRDQNGSARTLSDWFSGTRIVAASGEATVESIG